MATTDAIWTNIKEKKTYLFIFILIHTDIKANSEKQFIFPDCPLLIITVYFSFRDEMDFLPLLARADGFHYAVTIYDLKYGCTSA